MKNNWKSIHILLGLMAGVLFLCHPASAKIPDIIKTHPAFKGAPEPTYTNYQIKNRGTRSTSEWTYTLQSFNGTVIQEQYINDYRYRSKKGKKSRSQTKGTRELILGGLFVIEDSSTYVRRKKGEPTKRKIRKRTITSLSNISGKLFPLAVGNQLSFKIEKRYYSKQKQPKSKPSKTRYYRKKYTFQVVRVLSGKSFEPSLPGKIYVIERRIDAKTRKGKPYTHKEEFYYSDAYGIVVGHDWLGKKGREKGDRLSNISGTPNKKFSTEDNKTRVDKDYVLRLKVKAKGQLLHVFDGGSMLIITRPDGKIVCDSSLQNRAAFAAMINRQWSSDYELSEYRKYQNQIRDFIRIEGVAQVALFFRDTAAKMMVDVGIAYMTGDPSQFTKQVAKSTLKKAAKSAMKDTITSMIKDPDSYLRAMAVAMLKQASKELGDVERLAKQLRGTTVNYETMEDLDKKARSAYEKVVPSMVLIQGLRPGADVKSQVKSILKSVESRLKDQLPGDFDRLSTAKKKSVYSKMGGLIDELYKRYKPYRAYQKEMKKYQGLSNKGNSTRRAHYIEKIRYGDSVSKGYQYFSNK